MQADGVLDEPEWRSAEVLTGFTAIDPFTGTPEPYRTEAWVVATPEGLAVAVKAVAPREWRSYGRSPRDAARMDADPIRLMVDFDGSGRTAYEFTQSLSGSVRDGVLATGQLQPSYDWDGTWFHGVSEDDEAWYAEWLLPWSVAPTAKGEGETREMGVWLARFIKRKAHGYGFPAIAPSQPTFVSRMHRIKVPRYSTANIDYFPYASLTRDRLARSTPGRIGLDFTWKPDGPHQVTATLNPDFGQVESDDLMVNFSAIETFFSEKRPFFTENQSVFDLRLPNDGRLVNTRRIGSAPDAGVAIPSDIIAAAKYTGIVGAFEVGAFAALEDDTDLAEGRSFLVGRANYRGDRKSLGWIGTFADRPTRDRQTQVHGLDFEWTPADAVRWRGQVLTTLVDAPQAQDGLGAWLTYRNDPQTRLGQEYEFLWLDRNFDLNDLGYIPRRSLRQARAEWDIYQRRQKPGSPLAFRRYEIEAKLAYNDFSQRLPASIKLTREWRYQRPYGINATVKYETAGFDDLITRGGPAVRIPRRYEASVFLTHQALARARAEFEIKALEEGVRGRAAMQWFVTATTFINPNLSLVNTFIWLDSPDWLVFRPSSNELASFSRQLFIARQGFNWFPTPRQELRARLQWVALRAQGREAYDISASGRLSPRPGPVSSFHRSEIGFQLRYRYELKPLSDFFLVYARGGLDAGNTAEDDIGDLWRPALDQRTADQFVIKLRYRF